MNLFTLNDTYEATIYIEVELKSCIYISQLPKIANPDAGATRKRKKLHQSLFQIYNNFHYLINYGILGL